MDEASKTLFLWEFIKEKSSGISLNNVDENSAQSGITLSRKVKSTGYGPNGETFQYTLDLTSINKTFKEVAKANGWKFKIVLKREKALYPNGTSFSSTNNPIPPPIINEDQNLQQPLNIPEKSSYLQSKPIKGIGKTGILFWLPFLLLVLVTIIFFAGASTRLVGWALAFFVFVIVFFINKKVVISGCISKIIIWIIAFVVIFFIFAFNTDTSKDEASLKNSQSSSTSSKSSSFKKIKFNKTYAFPGDAGTFIIDLSTNEAKKRYELNITVNFTTSKLPSGFIWDANMTNESYQGFPATDGLVLGICSSKAGVKPEGLGTMQTSHYEGSKAVLNGIVTSTTGQYLYSDTEFLDFMSKYDKVQVLWYNLKEVGFSKLETKSDGSKSGVIAHEKAYGLHTPLADGTIPWNDIKKEIGF